MMTPIEDVLAYATAQDGDEYLYGVENSPLDPDPEFFDCSELVQWSCAKAHVEPVMPDGSWIQARHCKNYGLLVPVREGIDTRGALLFKFSADPFVGARPSSSHVAFSMGDGTTFEARSSYYDVGYFTAEDRGWTHAALIPGADYEGVDMDCPWRNTVDQGAPWFTTYAPCVNHFDNGKNIEWGVNTGICNVDVYAEPSAVWGVEQGRIKLADNFRDDFNRPLTDGRYMVLEHREAEG